MCKVSLLLHLGTIVLGYVFGLQKQFPNDRRYAHIRIYDVCETHAEAATLRVISPETTEQQHYHDNRPQKNTLQP